MTNKGDSIDSNWQPCFWRGCADRQCFAGVSYHDINGYLLCSDCLPKFYTMFPKANAVEPQSNTYLTAKKKAIQRVEKLLETKIDLELEPLETENWWYIPYGWIGCIGFIVDKRDEVILLLGSARRMYDCFEGYEAWVPI